MNTNLTRYASALLPLFVLIFGVLDAAQKTGADLLGWQTITQLVLLVVTTGAAYWLPLVPGKWSGALKTGAAIVGAIVSALVATIPDGHFTSATLILFLTAAFKAVAVQLGVTIRVDAAKQEPELATIGEVKMSGPTSISSADLVRPEPDLHADPALPATFEEAQDQAKAQSDDIYAAQDGRHEAV